MYIFMRLCVCVFFVVTPRVSSPLIFHSHTPITKTHTGALKRKGWEYEVDEGGGAFYGPKIDIKIRDAIGTCVALFVLCFVCVLLIFRSQGQTLHPLSHIYMHKHTHIHRSPMAVLDDPVRF